MEHDEGGEAACWLNRVCDACGALADEAPPTCCHRCGAPLPGPGDPPGDEGAWSDPLESQ